MTSSFVISGAGSGIGRATAICLSKSNPESSFYLIGRKQETLAETKNLLAKPNLGEVVVCDQSDRIKLVDCIDNLQLAQKNLKAVIANAGVGGGNQFGPKDRWDKIIDINLTGTYNLVSACIGPLQASASEHKNIVIVSSILANMGVPGYTAYCASKAGLNGLTRAWASQYAQEKIYFNAICPGWVETNMARAGIEEFADSVGASYDEAFKQQMRMVPTGKMATPDEIGELVRFLVDGRTSSITGQCLHINNGALM